MNSKGKKRAYSSQTRERDLAVCPKCETRTSQVTPKRGERMCTACGTSFRVVKKEELSPPERLPGLFKLYGRTHADISFQKRIDIVWAMEEAMVKAEGTQ